MRFAYAGLGGLITLLNLTMSFARAWRATTWGRPYGLVCSASLLVLLI